MERAARRSDVVLFDGSRTTDTVGKVERKGEVGKGVNDFMPAETPTMEMAFGDLIPPLERISEEYSYDGGSYSV